MHNFLRLSPLWKTLLAVASVAAIGAGVALGQFPA
jgi:hypothetical protein